MPIYDRDEVLARTDLEQLFVELVGPSKGTGRAAQWPCPSPEHAQSGKTPPATIDADRDGGGVWRCHGCGAGGSAIDVVMLVQGVGVGPAIGWLAERCGAHPRRQAPSPAPRLAPARTEAQKAQKRAGDPAALRAYVEACETALWSDAGADVLAYLRGRGLTDEALRANRVGADLGPAALARADGLPRHYPAAVFPLLDGDGHATYVQNRPLSGEPHYVNPTEATWGKSPRLALLRPLDEAAELDAVVVCEGMPDALTLIGAGYRAAAVLGAAQPDADVARRLVEELPTEQLVVAFDADERGVSGTALLGELLAAVGAGSRVWALPVPETAGDVNAWAQDAGDEFAPALEEVWATAATPLGWEPLPTASDLMGEFVAELRDRAGALAITTGIPKLDEYFAKGGWRPGVVLMGGVPGVGKSAFALQAALIAAGAGHPVLYMSVEQSPLELMGRIFCRQLGRPISDYWNREPAYLADIPLAAQELHLENLYVRTDPYIAGQDHEGTVGRLRRWVTSITQQRGGVPPLVVVDYLQRMRSPEADRRLDDHARVSGLGKSLLQLARDVRCPVVAISSVSRASYDKAPGLDAFKGSGDLEYDADGALLLRIDAPDADEAKRLVDANEASIPVDLFVVKNRYGALTPAEDPIRLTFDRRHGGFGPRKGVVASLMPAPPRGARQPELAPV
jgi:phage/plasmid primase-like uncharacterized protein